MVGRYGKKSNDFLPPPKDSQPPNQRDIALFVFGEKGVKPPLWMARPVHLIVTMIWWIRTSRLSIKKSLSGGQVRDNAEPVLTANVIKDGEPAHPHAIPVCLQC